MRRSVAPIFMSIGIFRTLEATRIPPWIKASHDPDKTPYRPDPDRFHDRDIGRLGRDAVGGCHARLSGPTGKRMVHGW